ncbi:hypothetical protein BGW36DRAFT_420574 [Talaromyces proteolyticus]|uniref:Zn(2)-C6 fungal-type domain-containing protein n=1 Tax=Talaromyces proteolyticus TaxID=1131652 RepID=A0AAD4PS05_9EURO|nr:uncharacterized protein BGW36DRAFT_420574 [Talaromyces proteolyticus]KAH8690160.1 hypothetical protein BGW36DRAFT_420574 [Talaromyces proteolyticus]
MRQADQTLTSKRQRARSKKSRTGCRTCRARHVKCDETPGACKRCTNTGYTCEYDLQTLPRSGKSIAFEKAKGYKNPIPFAVVSGPNWATTSDERRCFLHFQYRTTPTLLGLFDSLLWQEIVLQMSHSEPAVYHAVVALSAVHQDTEMYGMPLPGQDPQNRWHQFALEQCGRSFSLLHRRSHDPRLREIMLLCCILFVLVELLRGQYDTAFKHLHSGLRILKEVKADEKFNPFLLSAFTTLDMQSMQFGAGGLLSIGNTMAYQTNLADGLGIVHDLQEARQNLTVLLSAVTDFLTRCGSLTQADIVAEYEALHHMQLQHLSQLGQFDDCFEYFCSCHVFNSREHRGVSIIRLLNHSFSLALKTCLLRDDSVLECYTPEYNMLLSLVEDVIDHFEDRPSFTLDIGIIPALYFAAMWCVDYEIRCRAVEALQRWPHREGSFDSNWVAFIALERMKTESLTVHAELALCEVHQADYTWDN